MPTAVAGSLRLATIATGPQHACGLNANGVAYCWGDNYYGQLGVGDTLPHAGAVAVSGGMSFVAISVGFWHTCALTSNGAAYCWGYNLAGELGSVPTSAQKSTTPLAVTGGQTFASISAGSLYTCALTAAGAAYCWGWNKSGNLGDGTDTNRTAPTPVSASAITFAAVVTSSANKISPTTCALTTIGAAYCWGDAGDGQLGDPAVTSNSSLTPVPVSGALTFAGISVGTTHVCGVTRSSLAYCWGKNEHGQLGNGTTQASNVPVAVAGNLSPALTRHAWR